MSKFHAVLNTLICISMWSRGFVEENGFLQISDQLRKEYIRRAQVWHATDITGMDIFGGPRTWLAIRPGQEVKCRYVEPHGPSGGYAPKFKCRIVGSDEEVRIKFGSREVLAEVAGTRLLWALGFFTDEVYPVRIRCLACPEKNAFHPEKNEKRVERVFDDAILEPNFSGKEMGEYHDQGWKWQELDEVDESFGGSPKAHRDALKLLSVFIQHTDSKRQQQRLACYPDDFDLQSQLCIKPVLMVQDLGTTFGKGGPDVTDQSAMRLDSWISQPIWNRAKEQEYTQTHPGEMACIGNLTSARFAEGEGLFDPVISEDGRAFLAQLLNQLSDQQIHDLFRVARIDMPEDKMIDHGVERKVTIDDWAAVFKAKREEISQRHCN